MLHKIRTLAVIAVVLPCAAHAQTSPMDTFDYMVKLGAEYGGKTICGNGAVMGEYGQALAEYSNAHPEKNDRLTNQDVYAALVARFPCPFSPTKVPVNAASVEALNGYWASVQQSKTLTPNIFKQDPFPSKCEYFAFNQDGTLDSVQVSTPERCPTVKAEDFSGIPKVLTWRLDRRSLEIRRNDHPRYIEVWEPYVVAKDFSHKGSEFKQGDLLMFMAQFNDTKKDGIGNLYFRHMRRL